MAAISPALLAMVDLTFRCRFAIVDLEPCLGDAWREWMVGNMQLEATGVPLVMRTGR